MNQQEYVRGKVAEASKARGGIARIAREAKIDQRTVRALLKETHVTHISTLNTLEAYFRKSGRKVKETI